MIYRGKYPPIDTAPLSIRESVGVPFDRTRPHPRLEHQVDHRLLLDEREGHALRQSLDLDHRGHHHLDSIIIIILIKMSIAPPTHQ